MGSRSAAGHMVNKIYANVHSNGYQERIRDPSMGINKDSPHV